MDSPMREKQRNEMCNWQTHLLALGCHVLLATHFSQLQELADLYPACKLWVMQVMTVLSSVWMCLQP